MQHDIRGIQLIDQARVDKHGIMLHEEYLTLAGQESKVGATRHAGTCFLLPGVLEGGEDALSTVPLPECESKSLL